MSETLSDRMKNYERDFYLPEMGFVNQNMPVFVRLDGKAFHRYTKECGKPFDYWLSKSFQVATIRTCEEIGQVIIAYSQSDEVTFLLSGWQKPESQIYFGGKIQKIVSIISSIFSGYFNHYEDNNGSHLASFDARVWNVPEKEIENVFIWRQQDAKRNSIQALTRSLYSHKEVNGKNQQEQLEICLKEGQDWNGLSPLQKWGFMTYKVKEEQVCGDGIIERSKWIVDTNIPYFIENRSFIKDKLNVGE